jgi:hypothetical protein
VAVFAMVAVAVSCVLAGSRGQLVCRTSQMIDSGNADPSERYRNGARSFSLG